MSENWSYKRRVVVFVVTFDEMFKLVPLMMVVFTASVGKGVGRKLGAGTGIAVGSGVTGVEQAVGAGLGSVTQLLPQDTGAGVGQSEGAGEGAGVV